MWLTPLPQKAQATDCGHFRKANALSFDLGLVKAQADGCRHLGAARAAALARAQLLGEGRQRVGRQQRRQIDLGHMEAA